MLTLDEAKKIADAATAKALELGIKVSVCVVDDHGTVILTQRMDGAIVASPEFAFSKAYTSAVIGLPTAGIAQYVGDGKPLNGFPNALGGKLMAIPGGVPVKEGDKVIGAVGVGGSYDVGQDVACAEAAVSTIAK